MQIAHPNPDSKDYAALSIELREEIRAWRWAFQHTPVTKPITNYFAKVARLLSSSPGTVKTKYYALQKSGGDWRVLIDLRRQKRPAHICRTNDRSFTDFFKLLCEQNQRSTDAAIRDLKRRWRNREEIPGYLDLPNWPATPKGWSERNLRRHAPTALELSSMRFGIKTAAKHLPQIYSTRVGLWPGAYYQMDDVWHDNYVRIGGHVTRVLELGALDVLSGCRFAWGAKPRMPKGEGGGKQNLTEKEMRLFLAGVLYQHGINTELGTTLVIENGTATVREDIERILADYGTLHDGTPMIKISRSGLQGKQQAVLNLWGGRAGGNPRHKASLESLHNLIHNELAALTAQTGHDRTEPEMSHGIVSYQQRLLKVAQDIPEARRELLRHPIIDFHSQFIPLLTDLYTHAINGRTDHKLQGWHELGFLLTEYTTLPGSEHWLTLDALPDQSRAIVTMAAKTSPQEWSRTRKLSPLEVWTGGKSQLTPVRPHLVCDLLGKDLATERKVKGAYLTFTDTDISPEPLTYHSRIITPDGRQLELTNGEKYHVFSNPYDPAQLFVCDSAFRCLGIAPRITRVNPADTPAVMAAYGERNQRKAEILAPLRERHSPEAAAADAMRQHNTRVLTGGPVTAEEQASASAGKAADTRRTNKVTKAAQKQTASLTEETLDAWAAPADAPQQAPEPEQESTPQSFNPFSD